MSDYLNRKNVFTALLAEGMIKVYVDTNREGVVLPQHIIDQKKTMLHYGLNLPNPIIDLKVTDSGVSAVLSFNQIPFETFIPWEAIFMMTLADESSGSVVAYTTNSKKEVAPEKPKLKLI